MKNQPNGPGCFLFGVLILCIFGTVKLSRLPVIGLGENGFALGWLLVAAGVVIFIALGIAIVANMDVAGEVDQSGDIVTMTWTLANHIGMDNAQNLREQVAELKYPDTNNGIWRWKPGQGLSTFQALAETEYGVSCQIMTADELIEKGP